MRIKSYAEPLSGGGLRIRRIQDARSVGKRLIVFDDRLGSAEIVTDEMADQLHKRLAISQNVRFQHFGQKSVGKPDRENGRHPTGQQNRDDDVETLEAIVAAFLQKVSQ